MDKLTYAFKSDVGKVRQNNEDSIRIEFNNFGDQIFIVADGMGGHKAGDVASALACQIIGDEFLKLKIQPSYRLFLKDAILKANKEIYKRALLDPACNKMGTTVSIIIYNNTNIYTGHIGDSRIYYVNEKMIKQITKDHTLVRAMIDSGNIEEGQEKYSKYKNVLLQALGTAKKVTIEIQEIQLPRNFRFIICSDGLTGEVTDQKIYEIMNQEWDLPDKVDTLISYANEIDGSDNVSVIAIENRSEL